MYRKDIISVASPRSQWVRTFWERNSSNKQGGKTTFLRSDDVIQPPDAVWQWDSTLTYYSAAGASQCEHSHVPNRFFFVFFNILDLHTGCVPLLLDSLPPVWCWMCWVPLQWHPSGFGGIFMQVCLSLKAEQHIRHTTDVWFKCHIHANELRFLCTCWLKGRFQGNGPLWCHTRSSFSSPLKHFFFFTSKVFF